MAKDHLISMLFCVFAKCSPLRGVAGAMLGLSGKTGHFGLGRIPYRSTLSDANRRRSVDFFAGVYHDLLLEYQRVISDTRFKQVINKQIGIFDSTDISLFQDILKCAGRTPSSGKRKRGIKVHTVINVDEAVPEMVWFSSASTHDHMLLSKLSPDDNTIYVFDKGYNDYKAFKLFGEKGAGLIAAIYKIRWQTELLYRQLKGNFPLRYFLGDNGNAIKIQINCVLIVNLLLTVIQKRLDRPRAFSNLVSFCRIHLFNYLHLMKFLENPELDWQRTDQTLEMLTFLGGLPFENSENIKNKD